MRTARLPNVAPERIWAEAQDKLQPGLFTYESLQDGTAPIFDQLDDFKNLTPGEERKQDDEGILKLFTNVPASTPLTIRVLPAPLQRL